MLKWVLRMLYVMAVSLFSLQIYSFAYYSKLQEYYTDHVVENINNDTLYLNGINTLMGVDYYRDSPVLYEYIKDDGDNQLHVKIYAVGITSSDTQYDGYMILVNNVHIMDNGTEIDNPALKITIGLDANTLRVDKDLTNTGSIFYDPLQPFAYYNVPVLFLFDAPDYLQIPDTTTYANLTRIEVSYSDGTIDDNKNLVYNDVPLFLATTEATSESAQNKDATLSIDPDLYRLRSQFSNPVPTASDITTYNLVTDRGDMSPYNWTIWRTMIIYVLVVALVTYLLFFHKGVMDRRKAKHYGVKKDGTPNKESEAIFKDIEYKDKDGK